MGTITIAGRELQVSNSLTLGFLRFKRLPWMAKWGDKLDVEKTLEESIDLAVDTLVMYVGETLRPLPAVNEGVTSEWLYSVLPDDLASLRALIDTAVLASGYKPKAAEQPTGEAPSQ